MRKGKIFRWMGLLLWLLTTLAFATDKAIVLDINGLIDPAAQDYVKRGIAYATKQQAVAIILKLNTPGGIESSIRAIDDAILASPIPVITYVPHGGHANHAGTFIMYASHLAAMAPGSHIGIALSPPPMPLTNQPRTLNQAEKKKINDAALYMQELAKIHGRNADWADLAVRQSASLSAEGAKTLKVIDEVANDYPELLDKLNGHTVVILGVPEKLVIHQVQIENLPPGVRYVLLNVITNPNIAYILLLIAIYGLFFELSNPGTIFPGVIGTIALLLTLYAFQLMPVNYTGLTLILIGISFMIFEVYVSCFGISGIGGVIAFILGSMLLFDIHQENYHLGLGLIVAMSLLSITFLFMLLSLATRSRKLALATSKQGLIGNQGVVLSVMNQQIVVRVLGEVWEAHAAYEMMAGQKVMVTKVDGLILTVEPVK